MGIAAHFEQTSVPGTKSRAHRRKLFLEAEGSLRSGQRTGVAIHDISQTGLLIETDTTLEVGEKIDVELPQVGAARARVVWASGPFFGCEFAEQISTAALNAVQLRSAPAQPANVATSADVAPPSPPQPDESFGVRLHRLRTERGLTLSQIAGQLGVSKPTVWAWEQGKARPVDSRIEALASALGVTASELQPGRDNPAVRDIVSRAKEQVAAAFGVSSEKVRIMIDL